MVLRSLSLSEEDGGPVQAVGLGEGVSSACWVPPSCRRRRSRGGGAGGRRTSRCSRCRCVRAAAADGGPEDAAEHDDGDDGGDEREEPAAPVDARLAARAGRAGLVVWSCGSGCSSSGSVANGPAATAAVPGPAGAQREDGREAPQRLVQRLAAAAEVEAQEGRVAEGGPGRQRHPGGPARRRRVAPAPARARRARRGTWPRRASCARAGARRRRTPRARRGCRAGSPAARRARLPPSR